MGRNDQAETITIATVDLQALLDVADGFTNESGLNAARRYAAPKQVQQAIVNAKAAIRKVKS